MADRITDKQLDSLCRVLNSVVNGNNDELWTRDEDGTMHANIGAYHIDGAYGGVALYRMVTPGGGVSDISSRGHMTKRELYDYMRAYMDGIEEGRKLADTWRAELQKAADELGIELP